MASSKTNILPRGFKAKAERLSLEYRQKLGAQSTDSISAFDLATLLDVIVYTPKDIGICADDLDNVIGSKQRESGWSALTMSTQSGNRIIIHNDSHSPARQQSNLMHELAHIICEHTQTSSHPGIVLPMTMREYNAVQEEEANTLGAALMISRDGLVWALKKGWSHADIAEYYKASSEMVQFRINSTGVLKQLRYLRVTS